MKKAYLAVLKFLASERFFWLVIVLFIFQALWLVFSAVYPMAFDEMYHFTFIQLYAQQWSPFITEHPEGFDHLGLVTRDVSYLYHYLMSFPYRLINLFINDQVAQILLLRLINVGFFVAALVLTRRLLLKVGLSPALSHISLLLFTLIPIVPLLAAHINYDNLLILLITWMLLLVWQIIADLVAGKLPLQNLLLLAAAVLMTTVIKQAALPILLVISLFIVFYTAWTYRNALKTRFLPELKKSWQAMGAGTKVALVVLLLLGSGLFLERYGLNIVRYQALEPSCDAVLSINECMEFGPWGRNFRYMENIHPDFSPSVTRHLNEWTRGMWYRTFFMINGDTPVDRYQNFPPLPLPALAITAIFLLTLIAAVWHFKAIFRQPFVIFLSLMTIFYVIVLWYTNYLDYARLGRTVALNGRYFLLVAAPLLMIGGLGASRMLSKYLKIKMALALIAVLLALQGGGVLSFIVRSSETWYWPSPVVEQINSTSQNVLRPVIFGSQDNHLESVLRIDN